MNKITADKELSSTTLAWSSVDVGAVNGNNLRLRSMHNVAAEWHVHSGGDEMFMVLDGVVYIDTEHQTFKLTDKEFIVVPAGVRHRARVEGRAKLLVIDNFSDY